MRKPETHYASRQLSHRLGVIRASIATFIVLLAVGFAGYAWWDRQQSLTDARERLVVLVNVLADSVESQLIAIERQLTGMQKLLALQGISDGLGKQTIREVMLGWCRSEPGCMDLLIIDGHGEITDWTGAGKPPAVADREYVTWHLKGPAQRIYIGIPQLSRVHAGQWFFAVSAAERDRDGHVTQVFVSIRDLARSFDFAPLIRQTEGSSFAVVATSGEVLVREPDRGQHMGKIIPGVDEVIAATPGELRDSLRISRLDGEERLIVTRRLGSFPLFVAATRITRNVLEQCRRRLVMICALWFVLGALALHVGHRLAADARLQNYLASVDSLTGILNRRALMSEALRHEERRLQAGGLGLMMIDVDHFKRINDSFGHLVGDEVLRRVANTLRVSSRASDILGRYGGEEFLLLLPGADESRLAKVGEKLRAAVEAIPALEFAEFADYPQTLTISIGGTILWPEDGTLDGAIARADGALYEAKHAGRNRVVIASATAA